MDLVRQIGIKFYSEGTERAFPSPEELTFKNFSEVEEWSSLYERDTLLGQLTINECPKLTIMPWLLSLPHLELQNCNSIILMSTTTITSFSILVIDIFSELMFLPERLLQNNYPLISLTISSCTKLQSLFSDSHWRELLLPIPTYHKAI